nr:uncharacterized protein LOC112005585 isoform X2 [Quercus suber]
MEQESKLGFCHPTQHYILHVNQIYSACSPHLMLLVCTPCLTMNLPLQLCSLSLSLDSLLDYTDKDMQELTFELSLFAELLYEMLQYQMGSRILTFLQKLRVKFVTRRNQRKRKRDEIQAKERDKKSPVKRAKTSELLVKEQDSKSETLNTAQPNDDKTKVKEEDKSVDYVVEVKMEDETDDEDPEEDEEMEESGGSN